MDRLLITHTSPILVLDWSNAASLTKSRGQNDVGAGDDGGGSDGGMGMAGGPGGGVSVGFRVEFWGVVKVHPFTI
jgi:hypothetical protein